jgi:hypothetical protein
MLRIAINMRIRAVLCGLWLLGAALPAPSVELKQETVEAFNQYIHKAERQLDARSAFLWTDESPQRLDQVRRGTIVTERREGKSEIRVPDGLIHHWVGAAFLPGATLEGTLALVQDYNRHKDIYGPEVIGSKVLSRAGNDFQVYLKLLKKKVLTVVLNTTHDVRYTPVDETRWRSRSYSTRIAEVENGGRTDERELPPGQGHGFLWKLNSYWRFQARDGGTYIECEAVSLTRAIPTGLGWLIEPIVRNLPRESLEHTLRATRAALAK